MRAIQVTDFDKELDDLAPGEWMWTHEKRGIIFKLPNGHLGSVHSPRWTLSGDGDTITVHPSIWYLKDQGAENGEWHGWLTNGEWRQC